MDRVRSVARRVVFVLVILSIGAGWLIWAISASPSWYDPPDVGDEAVRDLGHGTEMFVLEQLHKVREDDDTWRFRLRNDQMNAWLAVNLPAWYEHQTHERWPEELGLPQVSAELEGVNVGFRLPEAFGDRLVTVRAAPEVTDEGRLRIELNRVGLGRITLPAAATRRVVEAGRATFQGHLDERDLNDIVGLVLGDETVEPVLELSDGRLVRIDEINLEADAIVFTCRTLRDTDDHSPRTVRTESDSQS